MDRTDCCFCFAPALTADEVLASVEHEESPGFLLHPVTGRRICSPCGQDLVTGMVKHFRPEVDAIVAEHTPAPAPREGGRKPIPQAMRIRVLRRGNFQCANDECRATENLQIDHVVPVARGGKTVDENLQVLCGPCNVKKGAR